MTDHRATHLSYGHLGEASYDLDEQSWYFSRDTSLGKLDRVE
jgi:RNA polymerase I-specific transcription initiation factor RRN6